MVLAVTAGVGFAVVQFRTPLPPPPPVVDAATLDQQRFVAELRPIHAEIQQGISETGLVVASYQRGSIGKAELQRRLAGVLASYHDAATQVDALDTPTDMRPTVQAYHDTLGALSQDDSELAKAYDDGDEGRVSAALALSLQATAQWHDIADVTASGARS
ncbi:MAG: hypothetical protein JO057_17095 [Chloroflexi bacterium]|nr:hypothetical protein [Chloroflexota bacterium]